MRLVTFDKGKVRIDELLTHITRSRVLGLLGWLSQFDAKTKSKRELVIFPDAEARKAAILAISQSGSQMYLIAPTYHQIQRYPSMQVRPVRLWSGNPEKLMHFVSIARGQNGIESLVSFIGTANSLDRADALFSLVRGLKVPFPSVYKFILQHNDSIIGSRWFTQKPTNTQIASS